MSFTVVLRPARIMLLRGVILGLDLVADSTPLSSAQRLVDLAFPRSLYVPPAPWWIERLKRRDAEARAQRRKEKPW